MNILEQLVIKSPNKKAIIEAIKNKPKTPLELSKMQIQSFNSAEGDGSCSICHGKEMFLTIVVENGIPYEVAKMCECVKHRAEMAKAEKNGMDSILKVTFDKYKAKEVWQRDIKNLAIENATKNAWWFIGGQSGSGKTTISAGIGRAILDKGGSVLYTIWTKDFVDLKYQRNDEVKFDKRIKELKQIEILFIDDLFKVKDRDLSLISNADIQILFEVINYRYSKHMKTIISSELTLQEIMKLDEALGSRIKERANEYVINLDRDSNKNWRLKNEI